MIEENRPGTRRDGNKFPARERRGRNNVQPEATMSDAVQIYGKDT
jgi:hypothetical protein